MEDYRFYIVQWLWLKVKNWTKPNDHDQGSTQWPSHYLAFLCELLGTVASAKAKLKPALAFLHLFSPWMLTPLQRWNTIWFVLTLLGNKVREWNGLFGCFLKDSDQEYNPTITPFSSAFMWYLMALTWTLFRLLDWLLTKHVRASMLEYRRSCTSEIQCVDISSCMYTRHCTTH